MDRPKDTDKRPDAWLVGGGEMGKAVRSMDWSKTPLGPIESWPQSLRTTVRLCLSSNFPISIAWGLQRVQIYNDGYWAICGAKHPRSLGQDFSQCWASAWPAIGEAFERALAGEASFLEDQQMFLDRNGYLEETFFTFSFSPIGDETGGVGGLFHPVTETTSKMVGQRRTRALRDLGAGAGKAQTGEDALALAAKTLSEFESDIPFALFYLVESDGKHARLAIQTASASKRIALPVVKLIEPRPSDWPIGEAVRTNQPVEVGDLDRRFGPFACGPYPEALRRALALPITLPGSKRPAAVLVAGVSPRLPLDDAYRAFYDLVAATVTSTVATARAYEEEQKRAEALAEIDRAKTAFFSDVSHEFRTPLTLMLGPLEDELAERLTPLPPARRERLETAHRNSLRLLKLVNTLLDFSRMKAGRAQATFEPAEPGQVGPRRPAASTATQEVAYEQEAMTWMRQAPGDNAPPSTAQVAPACSDGSQMSNAATVSRPRVLLAEDNADMREYVRRLLAEHYEVTAVSDGLKAVAAASALQPDLVLSDAIMPGLDGFGVLQQLRADERTRTIPVILLSARAGEESAIEGLADGADDYLVKPFSARELLARVRTHVSQATLRRQWALELEAANKELEGFSYSVSHDLRAPLRAISGFAQFLARACEGKLDATAQRWLDQVQSQARHMGRLIDELLKFSRLGRQPLKLSPLDMTALAQTVFNELTAQAAERVPQFDLKPLLPVQGDPVLMRQVFVNLLSNAIKFSRRHEAARIEIGSQRHGAENEYYVKDNGAGFDAGYAHKLFGLFQRLHSEDEFEGTGVGLALVQRIIHRHGGRILAEGRLNEGATFHFTLPASAACP